MVKILKIILIVICNIIYSLLLEVYWLAYYGVLGASGSIIFGNSIQRLIWELTPVFVTLIAGLGIVINTLLLKKIKIKVIKKKNG